MPAGGAAVGVAIGAGVGSIVAGFIVTLDLDATFDAESCGDAALSCCATPLFEVLPDGLAETLVLVSLRGRTRRGVL